MYICIYRFISWQAPQLLYLRVVAPWVNSVRTNYASLKVKAGSALVRYIFFVTRHSTYPDIDQNSKGGRDSNLPFRRRRVNWSERKHLNVTGISKHLVVHRKASLGEFVAFLMELCLWMVIEAQVVAWEREEPGRIWGWGNQDSASVPEHLIYMRYQLVDLVNADYLKSNGLDKVAAS